MIWKSICLPNFRIESHALHLSSNKINLRQSRFDIFNIILSFFMHHGEKQREKYLETTV